MKYLASYFVGSIRAIVVAVASPSWRYAIILGTREISAGMTRYRPATFLVAVIPTIVVVVTDPQLLDAVLVCAGKLIGPASVVWGKRFLMWEKWNDVLFTCNRNSLSRNDIDLNEGWHLIKERKASQKNSLYTIKAINLLT
jgi:hypothetical protein